VGPTGQREKRGRELRWAAAGLLGWAGMGRALGDRVLGCGLRPRGEGETGLAGVFLFLFLISFL